MATIFVAYGNRERRFAVLEFAARQASACGHDLVVHHVQESSTESAARRRDEIESVVQEIDPYLVYDIEIDEWGGDGDRPTRSKHDHLRAAIFERDRDVRTVVMGEVERGPIAEVLHSSTTKAVLAERRVPVTLVPI